MHKPIRWRWGWLAAAGMMLLALFPQLYLWGTRGRDWHGANAYFYTDEPAYAAYINALIDGRPRRNDPYTGQDEAPAAPQPESLFSIQFISAYLVAWPARVLGLSTATGFILLAPIVAGTTALALFWLLALLTDDERWAAACVPLVLCLGVLLSGNGLIRGLLGQPTAYVWLPFLRRYLPAAPFPFFMLFFPLVWCAFTSATPRRRLLWACAAALAFTVTVYGYFYLWTAAAAWLAGFALLWFVARADGWRRISAPLAVLAVLMLFALGPYFVLLAHRAPTMDVVQALLHTHAPDPWRSLEALALGVCAALGVGFWRGRLSWRTPAALCAVTCAVLPFVLFNQQIISGRSLQPMHYEQFVAPYLVLMAAALTASLLWRGRAPHRPLPLFVVLTVALGTFAWGAGETWIATRRFNEANVQRDEARPAALRLRELARAEAANASDSGPAPPAVVFAPDIARADNLPTVAPQPVLWAPHMFVFSGVTVAQNKERFFQYLYYSGVDADEFARDYWARGFVHYAIFGWERANPKLTADFKPITRAEIEAEQRNYAAYIAAFDHARATQPTLGYVLVAADQPLNFKHLDRWYTRDAGERLGRYLLYRVRPR